MTRKESAPNAPDLLAAAQWLPIADLRPNPRNPRMHGSEVTALARTILRTAWGAPIVAQSRGRRIIGGHGRLEAAKLILRGVEVDGEMRGGEMHSFGGPVGCVPVRLVDVSDAEADAMTLADNARGLQGTDDSAAIVAMAASFGRESALMVDMGFDAAALDRLVQSAGDAVLGAAAAPRDGTPAGDAATEWEGMPAFENPSDCHRKVWVSFQTPEDVAAFFAAIGQTDTGSTKSIWYPPKERRDLEGLRWQDGE